MKMKIKNNNFLYVFMLIHSAVFLAGAGILKYVEIGELSFLNFGVGSLLSALLVSSVFIVLKGVFFEKSFALPMVIIVFKYAFIGVFIYMLSSSGMMDNIFLAIGISTLLVSFLIMGIIYQRQGQHI